MSRKYDTEGRLRERLKRSAPDLLGLPTVSQFSRQLGQDESSVWRWLNAHDLLKKCPKVGRYRLVPAEIGQEYLTRTRRMNAERSPRRPQGYIGLKQAKELIGCSFDWVCGQARKGRCRTVQVGSRSYFHLEDVQRLKQDYGESPLPGYVQVRPFVEARGASFTTAIERLKALGGQPRKFRLPEGRQYAWYALPEDLERWETACRSHPNAKAFVWKPRTCPQCQQEYQPGPGWTSGRWCSRRCMQRHYAQQKAKHVA